MLNITNHDGIRVITLTRPPVNAINPGLAEELTEAIRRGGDEADALVLSGREGMFSAGLDVPELIALDRAGMTSFWESFFALLESLARSPVPVVASVTGHAPAGGAVMALFCDFRVMASGPFVIGLNETSVGLMVPEVIQKALVRLVGAHRAERLIVSGALLSPGRALELGLIDETTEDAGEAVKRGIEWCRELLDLPRHAMSGNRQMLRADLGQWFEELGQRDIRRFVDGWFEPSTQAALGALLSRLKSK